MLTIVYSGIGDSVNDFRLDDEIYLINKMIASWDEYILYYSTENIFTRIRLEIISGNISCDNIQFEYEGENLPVNRFGAIMNWPNGFCDVNIRMSESILRKAINKKKLERNLE